MIGQFKGIFTKKNQQPRFTREEYEDYFWRKKAGLERVLGEMHEEVGLAIIPFQVGGALDVYYFPHALPGTGLATMDLIDPDGSGPQPSNIGTYELLAFTRSKIDDAAAQARFHEQVLRMRGIFTLLGRYSFRDRLSPLDTVEVPRSEREPYHCTILDEYTRPGVNFMIGERRHSLLLVIEVFRSEMEHAMRYGSQSVIARLSERGHYPYSDLDREPVF